MCISPPQRCLGDASNLIQRSSVLWVPSMTRNESGLLRFADTVFCRHRCPSRQHECPDNLTPVHAGGHLAPPGTLLSTVSTPDLPWVCSPSTVTRGLKRPPVPSPTSPGVLSKRRRTQFPEHLRDFMGAFTDPLLRSRYSRRSIFRDTLPNGEVYSTTLH